jgi:uncharacterized protein YkwD
VIRVHCPACRVVLEAPDQKAGAVVACPRCRQAIKLPVVAPQLPSAPVRRAPPPLPRTTPAVQTVPRRAPVRPPTSGSPFAFDEPKPSRPPRRRSSHTALWLTAAVLVLLACGAGGFLLLRHPSATPARPTDPVPAAEVASVTPAPEEKAPAEAGKPDEHPRPPAEDKSPPPPADPPLEAEQPAPPTLPREQPRPVGPQPDKKPERRADGAVVYPGDGQQDVPLWFPGNEIPDPIPEAPGRLAGYPVTVSFPLRVPVLDAEAGLKDADGKEVAAWISTPERPANKMFTREQQNTICIIARQPLRPASTYTAHVRAKVRGKDWSLEWSFTTASTEELFKQLSGQVLQGLNERRKLAGLAPVPRDDQAYRACTAHADYLSLNAFTRPNLNWNDEQEGLPGYTREGKEIARGAIIQGGGGAREALNSLLESLISRDQILTPELESVGLGQSAYLGGGWLWVATMRRIRKPDAASEVLYPTPDQKEVPLTYPLDEVPSPVPKEHRDKEVGYAITAWFPFNVAVTEASAELRDGKGKKVDGWVSSPEKRAIPTFPQRSICFLPGASLQAGTKYTATFSARVGGQPWKRTWSFTTVEDPDTVMPEVAEKMLARVNYHRRNAGLAPVKLDPELSKGCQLHARYLSRNANNPATRGLEMHREDPSLPGATPEGARAARGVIAAVSDPLGVVDSWMATLYHRLPILAPNLERVGFGQARFNGRRWSCVLDTASGRTR